MANYSAIKAVVNAYIKQNGRKEITGSILNAILNSVIDSLGRYYQFAGGAMPSDDPGTPDQNVCYLATEPGVYTNFGGITIENEEVALLFWNGTWTKQRILIGIREVEASVDNQVGTPSVDVSYGEGRLILTFHNLKGEQGDQGDPAGFGTIGADITGGVGTPGVSVETSGGNDAKNIMFHFTNLKGETGVTSVVATIDDTSGTPSCQVSLVGGQLTLAFSGLKGLKGDTGVSADYPITIYNGLDSDATDQALSAAQGKVLDGKITRLEHEVDDLEVELADAIPLEIEPSLTWTDGMVYNGNGVSTNSSYQLSSPFLLKKGYTVKFSGGKGTTSLSINAISQYNNGAYSLILAYSAETESIQYTAPQDVEIAISTLKSSYGGSVKIQSNPISIQEIEKLKIITAKNTADIGPKLFHYTDNNTINPYIESISVNKTFTDKKLGFYVTANGIVFQFKRGLSVLTTGTILFSAMTEGIMEVPMNVDYSGDGVIGVIRADVSKLSQVADLGNIVASEVFPDAWLNPSIQKNLDAYNTAFLENYTQPGITWEDGMIYNGSGVSTNSSYQKTTINLRRGETVKFHGGYGSPGALSINAVTKVIGTSLSAVVVYSSDDEDISYTAPFDMQVIVDTAKTSYGGTLYVVKPSLLKEVESGVRGVVVDKNGNGDYTSLSQAIIEQSEVMGAVLYVKDGVYDIIQELTDYYGATFFSSFAEDDLHRGLYLKNRIKIVFSTRAIVKCEYTGADTNVMEWLSPFNSGVYGFELVNATIECKNVRYCFHDERGGSIDEYRNVYKNCRMYMDNTGNTGWASKNCIGGGLGKAGDIVIEDCYFKSEGINQYTNRVVHYHNNLSPDSKSNIVIRGCYADGIGTFGLQWYGTSVEITRMMATNNSVGSQLTHAATNPDLYDTHNTELVQWNNIIRS